jgi:hypothetical protein
MKSFCCIVARFLLLLSSVASAHSTTQEVYLTCVKDKAFYREGNPRARKMLIMDKINLYGYSPGILKKSYPKGFSEDEKDKMSFIDKTILENLNVQVQVYCYGPILKTENVDLLPENNSVLCEKGYGLGVVLMTPSLEPVGWIGFKIITIYDDDDERRPNPDKVPLNLDYIMSISKITHPAYLKAHFLM